MKLLHFFESIRFPVLDELMLLITRLGEETVFILVGLVLYWCVNKRRGIFVMTVGLAGTVISHWMKIVCRIPRPWVRDPSLNVLERAKASAGGYSFPSGHTQTAVGTFVATGISDKRKWFGMICFLAAVLVGISRMYVGVHTLADVAAGACISIVLIVLLYPLMMGKKDRTVPVLAGLTVLNLAFLLYMECTVFPKDIDVHNLESASKNAYTTIGTVLGILVVYPLEKRWLNFSEKGCWIAQLLKIVLGFGVVLLIKEGLRSPLETIFAGHLAARAVRYFLLVVVAGLVWPLTFGFFNKITGGKKDGRAES